MQADKCRKVKLTQSRSSGITTYGLFIGGCLFIRSHNLIMIVTIAWTDLPPVVITETDLVPDATIGDGLRTFATVNYGSRPVASEKGDMPSVADNAQTELALNVSCS